MKAESRRQEVEGLKADNQLPQGWAKVELQEVGEIITGNTPSKKDADNYGNDYPWVKPADLDTKDIIKETAENLSEKGAEKARLLEPETVMVSCIGILGKVGFAGKTLATNQQINSITFDKRLVYPRYGFFYCKTLSEWMIQNSSATTVSIINKTRFSQAPFLLPPLNEQKRIVAKLEKLLAKVNDSCDRLSRIPTILKRFRQSVLASACSGRLTADWRKQHPNIEPAEELLKRIQQEKKIKNKFSLKVLEEELKEIPDTWKWLAIGNYAECNRGKFSVRPRNDPNYYNGKYPFIQIGDLPREGGFISHHTQTLNEKGLGVSKMFPKGTVAIAIVGATIGNTGILDYDMCFPDSLVGIQTGNDISNIYIDYYLRSEKEKIRLISYAGGGQPNIKLQTLNPYPFPLPPFEEQKEIVKRVKALFKKCDLIEQRYLKAKTYTSKLTQSILAKAFRGELVPQDPNDEPAEVLLERIREEKALTEKSKKGKNTSKRKTT